MLENVKTRIGTIRSIGTRFRLPILEGENEGDGNKNVCENEINVKMPMERKSDNVFPARFSSKNFSFP